MQICSELVLFLVRSVFCDVVEVVCVLSDCRHKAMVQCRGQRGDRLQVERVPPSSKIDLIKVRQ